MNVEFDPYDAFQQLFDIVWRGVADLPRVGECSFLYFCKPGYKPTQPLCIFMDSYSGMSMHDGVVPEWERPCRVLA